MQVNVTGHHVELTNALRDYVGEKLVRLERHYDNITNVQITLSVEKERQQAVCTLHAAGGDLHAEASDADMYAAIDLLADKLDRQLIKHKEKAQARAQGAGARQHLMTTLESILPPERTLFEITGGSKKRLLEFFSTFIAQNAPSLDSHEVFSRLISRERLGSTGIGNGVAIPHARSPHCKRPIAGFMRLQDTIDFDAIDGEPVDLVFVLLVPEEADDAHLSLLAEVAGIMNQSSVRQQLRQAGSQQALHNALVDAIRHHRDSDDGQAMQLVIISGLSGSGKSIALQALEDLGYCAIDNLPANLLAPLIDELRSAPPSRPNVAVSIDARNLPESLERFPLLLDAVRGRGIDTQTVYLTADAKILLERYSATRRRHPLTRGNDMTLAEAIDHEQGYLAPIRHVADLVIDTQGLSVHDLRARIGEQVAKHTGGRLTLTFESFGFKRGVPFDADMVFDARCLPNPFWDPGLRNCDGRDAKIIEFLESYTDVHTLAEDIHVWLNRWLPAYLDNHRSYLTVAIGCTGGQHRSVYLVERVAHRFQHDNADIRLRHRELGIHTSLSSDSAAQHSSVPPRNAGFPERDADT